jgi:hypothetical protein
MCRHTRIYILSDGVVKRPMCRHTRNYILSDGVGKGMALLMFASASPGTQLASHAPRTMKHAIRASTLTLTLPMLLPTIC